MANLYQKLDVPREDWNTPAGEIIAFCHTLRVPAGRHLGKQLRLRPLQLDFVRAVYNPQTDDGHRLVRQAYLSIARRSGKSTIAAALVLAHLVGPARKPNSMLISAANDRFQASVVFKAVADMLRAHEDILPSVKIVDSTKRITARRWNSVYMAISAEAHTKLGIGPDMIVFDELGSAKSRELYDVLISSQGSQTEPLFMAISTQAPSDDHFFSLLIDYAVDASAGRIDDPTVVGHLHSTPPHYAIDDEEGWRLSNPGLGDYRDKDEMRRAAAKAIALPSFEATFRNLYLNQRVSQHATLFTPLVWDACAGPVDEAAFVTGRVYAGLDLSSRLDLTALVFVVRDVEERVHVILRAWTPADSLGERMRRDRAPYRQWVEQGWLEAIPGNAIDLEYVAHEVARLCGLWNVQTVAFDRWRMDLLEKELTRIGAYHVPLSPHGQGFKDMSPAIEACEQLVMSQRLRHGGHPLLRWCIANCMVTGDPAGNRKLDKAKSYGRIDPAVALMMAIGAQATTGDTIDVATMIG